MAGFTDHGAVEPPFGCTPFRPVGEVLETAVARLAPDNDARRARYFAEGPYVIVTATRRRMDVPAAYEEALRLLARSVDPKVGTLAEAYADELADLIAAMRTAMGAPTLPPAAAQRAA